MSAPAKPTPADDELDAALRALLAGIAPDADVTRLDSTSDIRSTLDIDSFDFLQFVIGVKERLGVEIPESDYAQVRTLESCVRYVAQRRRPTPS